MLKNRLIIFVCVCFFISTPFVFAEKKMITAKQMQMFWSKVEFGGIESNDFVGFVQPFLNKDKSWLEKIPYSKKLFKSWVNSIRKKYYTVNKLDSQGMILFFYLVQSKKIHQANFNKFLDKQYKVPGRPSKHKEWARTMVVFWKVVEKKDLNLLDFSQFLMDRTKGFKAIKELRKLVDHFLSPKQKKILRLFEGHQDGMMKKMPITAPAMIYYYSLKKKGAVNNLNLKLFLNKIIEKKIIKTCQDIKSLRNLMSLPYLPKILQNKYNKQIYGKMKSLEMYNSLLMLLKK